MKQENHHHDRPRHRNYRAARYTWWRAATTKTTDAAVFAAGNCQTTNFVLWLSDLPAGHDCVCSK